MGRPKKMKYTVACKCPYCGALREELAEHPSTRLQWTLCKAHQWVRTFNDYGVTPARVVGSPRPHSRAI